MLTHGLWNGGAERQLTLLASSLFDRWSVSVVSMEDGPYRPILQRLGIDVTLIPRHFRFDVTAGPRIWRFASEFRPDVVHSWGWIATLAMVPYCQSHGIPLLNGTIRFGDLPPRRACMYRLGLSLSDGVVANSRAGLAAFGLLEGPRCRVIYNAFDQTRLAGVQDDVRTTARRVGAVVVMTARMSAAKDWDLFIQAARLLAADASGWKFIGFGDGPSRQAIMREAADLVSEGVVAFPEVGLDVLSVIASADAGVLLSDARWHAEGCSNSILEYMACGLPVVCTDSGGNPELVEDGVTGFLVPPADVDSLVFALRTLRNDPERSLEMGREGASAA